MLLNGSRISRIQVLFIAARLISFLFKECQVCSCPPPPPPPQCSCFIPGCLVGLFCWSVVVGWIEKHEVAGCGASASGWAPLRPHCLCWMKMVVEVGVAWAGGPRTAVFSLTLILDCWLFSGSGSSDTPGRSSRGCSCGWEASQGSELAEEGWCWPPGNHLGSAVAQGPNLKPLFLQLHTSGSQIHCRAFHC